MTYLLFSWSLLVTPEFSWFAGKSVTILFLPRSDSIKLGALIMFLISDFSLVNLFFYSRSNEEPMYYSPFYTGVPYETSFLSLSLFLDEIA